jgi:hypothetical protein
MNAKTIKAGVIGGLLGGVVIWIYEIIVWINIQHLMPLSGLPSNATGLVFGQAFKDQLGAMAGVLGAGIHFGFSAAWGVLFALIWPFFARRRVEATLVALFYAIFAWIVMHLAIIIVGQPHPNYGDATVVISGFMSHFCFTIPMALYIKRALS